MSLKFESPLRQVRSFVLRTSRLTAAQSRAISELWPKWGWDGQGPSAAQLFERQAPIWIEIGIGNGDALIHAARLHPEINFIGIEVHTPGIGHCLRQIEAHGLSNVRLCDRDAIDVLSDGVSAASVDQINLYFPDPWHKKRHHKRRIVNDRFCALCASALKADGVLHLATDWPDYAQWMQETLARHEAAFVRSAHDVAQRPPWRPETRFERRGLGLGHPIVDLLYRRG